MNQSAMADYGQRMQKAAILKLRNSLVDETRAGPLLPQPHEPSRTIRTKKVKRSFLAGKPDVSMNKS